MTAAALLSVARSLFTSGYLRIEQRSQTVHSAMLGQRNSPATVTQRFARGVSAGSYVRLTGMRSIHCRCRRRVSTDGSGDWTASADERGFLSGGVAYVQFALENPGFYEVLFRPSLCHQDDPEFKQARTAAFDILYGSARRSLTSACDSDAVTKVDVASLVIAGWSMVHGYATLLATENFADRPAGDIFRGVELLASLLTTPSKG